MVTVLDAINGALHEALRTDDRVYILGEDILDPYGGAFKVTRGLSSAFPERVLTTPISEGGFVGVATGMALRGLRPVVEIMFGDFTTLIVDQIVNHAAKFRWMYDDKVRVPLVVRTPMGGRRGYGATHSQSLERLFLGVPGLRVLAPSALGDSGALLVSAIADDDPVLFVEGKLLYLREQRDADDLGDLIRTRIDLPGTDAPAYRVAVRDAGRPTVTLATYGFMAELVCEALIRLAYEFETFAEAVVLTQLSPFVLDPVFDSVAATGRLMVVEEGVTAHGWGSEVVAATAEHLGHALGAVRRVGALDCPIPSSLAMEERALPGVDAIVKQVVEMSS